MDGVPQGHSSRTMQVEGMPVEQGSNSGPRVHEAYSLPPKLYLQDLQSLFFMIPSTFALGSERFLPRWQHRSAASY